MDTKLYIIKVIIKRVGYIVVLITHEEADK